jgi:hypothetical protein
MELYREIKQMKKSFRRWGITAAVVIGVMGGTTKADADLLIDFDNTAFDGGTVTESGGIWTGTGIIFDSIFLKDTALVDAIAGVQCGATNTGSLAADPAETCKLNFSTATKLVHGDRGRTASTPSGQICSLTRPIGAASCSPLAARC